MAKAKIYRLFTSKRRSFTPELIGKILEHHKGSLPQFIEEIACKNTTGNYTPWGAAVFWQETPPQPEWSNWFAYQFQEFDTMVGDEPAKGRRLVITGLKTFDPVVEAILEPTMEGGRVAISRFGHDFVQTPSGLFIDGGRDYTRFGGWEDEKSKPELVRLNLKTMQFKRKGRAHNVIR